MELALNSDFKDYYDVCFDANSKIIYNRIRANMQRAKELKLLRNIGVKTIDLYAVNELLENFNRDELVVVYTDALKHNGNGKKIVTVNEAMNNYKNCLASRYMNVTNGFYIKYLQVGKRRFNITMFNNGQIKRGNVYNIQEINQDYNRLIGLPIFSIDYIADYFNNMIAIDFNTVENIESLNINKIMTAEEVKREIYDSMLIYNKI